MTSTQEQIDDFVTELRAAIPLAAQYNTTSNVPALALDKLYIYFYPPGASRRDNHAEWQTLHIDLDVIQSGRDKVIHRIQGMLGLGERIYARETVAARIDKKVALEFQEEHHLQVALPGKYRYGLFHQGELVSVAVFSGGRHMHDQPDGYRSFELLRFCHKTSYNVIGGVSKLIDKFVSEFHPSDIMTYADLDWCQQSSLEKIGFVPIETKAPQTFWVVDGVRHYRKPVADTPCYEVHNSGSLKLKRTF